MATWLDIPEAKPAFELFDGELYQKVSSRRRHAILQGKFLMAIAQWAHGRGDVGAEWRFRISDGAKRHALVPDVAYVAHGRLRALHDEEEREEPPFAPDIAVEILSPGDNRGLLALKTAAYLACGGLAVLIVEPLARTAKLHTADGTRRFESRDRIEHPLFPGLLIDLADMFAALDRS